MAFMDNGDIIAVWRTELILSGSDDNVRRNPLLFIAEDNYRCEVIDFGDKIKPSGWLQNCGGNFIYPEGCFMFAEYTRPSVEYARVWRVIAPYNDPQNWKEIMKFELSGQGNEGFKHCHAIQYDHYTGVVYATTGDDDTAAAVYHSLDGGKTFELSHPTSEKYCRMLNFIFTQEAIYWTSDTYKENYHFIFKAKRLENGVIDYDTLEEICHLPLPGGNNVLATYSTVYLETLNVLVLLERCDAQGDSSMPFRLFDLNDNTLHVMGVLKSVGGTVKNMGFRNEYVELYPKSNIFRVGFGGKLFPTGGYLNHFDILGNKGVNGGSNINNLVVQIDKKENTYMYKFDTVYL